MQHRSEYYKATTSPIGTLTAEQVSIFPTKSLFLLPVTETGMACCGEAVPLPSTVFRRETRSPPCASPPHFYPHQPWPSSAFFINCFYSMSLPHAVFPVLLSRAFRCSNGLLDIISKASRVDIPKKDDDSEDSSLCLGSHPTTSTDTVPLLCHAQRYQDDQQESSQAFEHPACLTKHGRQIWGSSESNTVRTPD